MIYDQETSPFYITHELVKSASVLHHFTPKGIVIGLLLNISFSFNQIKGQPRCNKQPTLTPLIKLSDSCSKCNPGFQLESYEAT